MRPIIESNRCDGKEANTDSTNIHFYLLKDNFVVKKITKILSTRVNL